MAWPHDVPNLKTKLSPPAISHLFNLSGLADVRAAGDGGAGGGAAGRLRHHLRALSRLRRSPPRRPRDIRLFQVSISHEQNQHAAEQTQI